MPFVWQMSRWALMPIGVFKRNMAQLRPLGLAPGLQKGAARAIWETALEDLLSHATKALMFRRMSQLSLAVTPGCLLVDRHREMGNTPAMLYIDSEDAFAAFRFDTSWTALNHILGPHKALPLYRLLLGGRSTVSWCRAVHAEWIHIGTGGCQGTTGMPL